jgi:hypothetical protein
MDTYQRKVFIYIHVYIYSYTCVYIHIYIYIFIFIIHIHIIYLYLSYICIYLFTFTASLESAYGAMGMSCADVGGFKSKADSTKFAPGMEPCGGKKSSKADEVTPAEVGVIVLAVIMFLFLCTLGNLYVYMCIYMPCLCSYSSYILMCLYIFVYTYIYVNIYIHICIY